MRKSEMIHEVIFLVLAIASCFAFLFFLFSNQIFNSMQCLFLFLCLYIPSAIQLLFKIKIAPFMSFIYEIFLILHFVFGEIINFYVLIKHYDTMLHFLTAILLTIFGYSIIHFYLDNKVIFIQIIFAVLFGLTSEYLWEILEFCIDHFCYTNMQRFIKDGVVLKGHLALVDTTKDMVVALIGCLLSTFLFKIKLFKDLKINIYNKKNQH